MQVDVAFSVVRFKTPYGEKRGVATTWLDTQLGGLLGASAAPAVVAAAAAGNDTAAAAAAAGVPNGIAEPGAPLRLPVFLRHGGAFRPPQDVSTPLIMVGPGTGVAPFRCALEPKGAK